ncbi:hypothetical protein GJ496_000972 [Pomphorhynchus laevis]|nr:hypothetical protein GJ496_000972 [Pomphorhynchus laevis]
MYTLYDRRDWNWWYVQVSLLKRKLKSFLIILSSLINAKLAYNNKLRITNLCSKSGAIADIIHFTDIGAMTYFVLSHLQMNNECSDIPSIFSLTNTEKSEHTLNINDSNNNFYIKEENDSRFLPTVDHFNQKSPNNATISVNKWGAFEDDGSMQLRRKQTVENVELDSLISNEYNSFDNYLSDL